MLWPMSAISSATGGLRAAAVRLADSASNVAAWGAGAVEAIDTDKYVQRVQPAAPPRPVRPLLTLQAQGEMMAAAQDEAAEGRAASGAAQRGAGIDLARETVEQVQAMAAFHANLSMIRTADEMDQALFDILA